MMKYRFILILLCIFTSTLFSSEPVSIDNWMNNKDISKIREIYKQVQSSRYDRAKKIFNTNSTKCSTYPIKEKSILVDNSGVIRKLSVTQLISHREPLLIERYYDSSGVIRFIFTKSLISEIRIYLNDTGDVIWAVTKDNSKFSKADYTNSDWETKPSRSKDAKLFYNESEKCPSL